MTTNEKAPLLVKLNEEESSEEVVNDSLGEVTPADATGLGAEKPAQKQGHGE